MQIHTLVPGLHIQDVTVEIHALHGAAASQASGGSTTYRAVVKDSTGLCTLIYRQGPRCNPSGVRKANCYKVTGQVVLEGGQIVVEASAVEKTHESVTFNHVTDHTDLINFSDQQHLCGVLLLHQQQQQWHVLLSPRTSSSSIVKPAAAAVAAAAAAGHGASSSSSIIGSKSQIFLLPKTLAAPVPLGFMTGALSAPAAACRVLDQALQLQNPGSYVLLPLPAAACVLRSSSSSSSSSGKCIVHLYAAVTQGELPAAVARNAGQWVAVDQIWQQQQQQQWFLPVEWQAPIQALLSSSLAFLGSSSSSSQHGNPDHSQTGNHQPDIKDISIQGPDTEADNEEEQQQHHASPAGQAAAAAAAAAADTADPAAAAAEPGSSSSSVEWQPGMINVITQGAGQLQQLLNNINDRSSSSTSSSGGGVAVAAAAVVHWLAPWAVTSTAAEARLQTLAVTYLHIPVISVNVTVSDKNKDLALEKVMEVPQSYRKGGRKFQPVPKLGGKWPCVTLHNVPLLHPVQVFSGPAAGQQLLLALQGMDLLINPQRRQQGRPGSSTTVGSSGQDDRQQQSAAAVQPAAGFGTGAKGPLQQQQQQPPSLQQITKGATDLKLLLQQVHPHDLLLVTWSNSSSSSSKSSGNLLADQIGDLLSNTAARHNSNSSSDNPLAGRQMVVAAADAAATAANKALAAALKVAAGPTVQVYHNKQLVKAVKVGGEDTAAAAAAAKVQAAVLQLQLLPVPKEQPQQVAVPNSSSSSSGYGVGGSRTEPVQHITAAAAASSSSNSSSDDAIWDPPTGRPAKPGFKRRFPTTAVYTASSSSRSKHRAAAAAASVAAVYWPRMPCLNCGCPWWLGEDWDAACARCGWTCENDGYDDDSNVLPEYEARYNMICDSLKQGKTPTGLLKECFALHALNGNPSCGHCWKSSTH